MRFSNLRAKGIGPFRDEISVNFDAIDGLLIAITGENGAGKSTLLELLAGGMYRTCPTRGPLSGLATVRDAFLEVGVVNGASHRLRHVVDKVSGKGESVVTDGDGRPLVASGKMREFDAWAAKHLPPPEVLYASTFAAQGSGGFLDLKPADRKGVLLRVLGIERLEALAERARDHVRSRKTEIATLEARLGDERARASDPATVSEQLKELLVRLGEGESNLVRSKATLAELVEQEENAKAASRSAEEAGRRRTELDERIASAKAKFADITRRLANNEGLIGQKKEIRAAQDRVQALDAQLLNLGNVIAEARVEESAASRDRAAARDLLADISARSQRGSDRRKRIATRLEDKATIDLAAASVPDLRAAVSAAEGAVEAFEAAIREATDLTLSDATQRLDNLRAPLRTIASGVESPVTVASAALEEDDRAAQLAVEVPKALAEDRRHLERARSSLSSRRRELAAAEKTAARAVELTAAETELVEVTGEMSRLEEEEKGARASYESANEIATQKAAVHEGLLAERRTLETERVQLDPLVKLADRLTQAEARISELEPQSAVARAEITELEADRAALPEPGEPPRFPDVAGARNVVETLDRELRSIEAAIAVKETQLSEAEASEKRTQGLVTERRRCEDDLADWIRLAEDLGRDGLQALEIDAAGPELTELVNDLLRTCVGSRWTVSIEASRISSDGKKTLEGCEVRVLDTERGREGTAESLSGGESVLVGEAVSLALCMLACRRSGVEGPTLVRDESGAALDPTNARAYIAMLRRAAEIVGASHVLFVSHSAEVQELADARIEVSGGKVRVAA